MKTVGLLGALLLVGLAGCSAPTPTSADQVAITFHYSRFEPRVVSVPAGVPVRFTLRNDDPIEHEWIVGPPAVHAAHRTGTEPFHEGRPDEVTVPAYAARETTLTFEQPGEYDFICHLPGHEAYGMSGRVSVLQPRNAPVVEVRRAVLGMLDLLMGRL
jgi:uncharacterized cupredoxin-like copper-binding protein